MSHQFCSSRLVLQAGQVGGGWVIRGGGGGGLNKAPGLTLIVHNLFLNDEKKVLKSFFLPLSVKMVSIKEVVTFLLVSSPICQLRPKIRDGHEKCKLKTS